MAKYYDPLHVPIDHLIVMHKGKEKYLLNKRLLDQQNCWENLEKIKAMHVTKLDIYDAIEDTNDPLTLRYLARDLRMCEFELQKLWGFEEDANYHRFWEAPKCACPKLDNEDMYPYQQIYNLSCVLHIHPKFNELKDR